PRRVLGLGVQRLDADREALLERREVLLDCGATLGHGRIRERGSVARAQRRHARAQLLEPRECKLIAAAQALVPTDVGAAVEIETDPRRNRYEPRAETLKVRGIKLRGNVDGHAQQAPHRLA